MTKKFWLIASIVIAVALALFFTFKFKFVGNVTKATESETEMVKLNYKIALKENSQVIDSGETSFALGSVAANLGFKTDKIDSIIAEMKEGEEKTIELEPADAYGEYNAELVFQQSKILGKVKRVRELERTRWLDIQFFVRIFGEQPLEGKEYSRAGLPWPIKVVEKNDSHVKISHEAKIGDKVPEPLGLFFYEVINVTNDTIKMRLQGNDTETSIPTPQGELKIKIVFSEDEVRYILMPSIGQELSLAGITGRVISFDENTVTIDANPTYAGKTILVTVKLLEKYKEKISAPREIPGAPKMQVFIMSYCPFGLQFLKGLLPVWKKFIDKANIELRFVSYTMHGQKEEEENKRMICIREEQSSKLLAYLECFVKSGDSAGCIKEAGIDKDKLESCMQSRAEKYFAEDKELNEKYGVQGSPTVVIDGKQVEIWPRSPENIKEKLCEAFTSKPSECNEKLSEENPSPGFGLGTSSAGGTC